jgi:UrcA family protein
MSNTFVATVAIGLVGCTSVVSTALAAAPARTATVSYADLDLDTEAGVEALYRRLLGAAHAACNPLDRRGAVGEAEFQVCKAEALTRAVADIGNPRLTARLHGWKGAAARASVAGR